MTQLRNDINDALTFLRTRTAMKPEIGIILGTGLGGLAKEIVPEAVIDYASIPHFPLSTVESHQGKLIFGTLGGHAAGGPAACVEARRGHARPFSLL